jgi:hypothetical protein
VVELDERLRVLAGWAPTLASGELEFGHWVVSKPDADGVTHMPWYDYSPEARRFMAEVVGAGWVQPFDWMAWASGPAGQALIAEPERVATVGADDLQRLLTAIIRGDRFIEGNVVGAYESGMLLAIALRAQVLITPEDRASRHSSL